MPTPARLAVLTSILLAAPAAAQDSPAAVAPPPPPLSADGRGSLFVLLGAGSMGPAFGFGGALGGAISDRFRLDVFADVLLDGGGQAGYAVAIARGTIGLALGYRAGRLEPWVGLGIGAARASASREENLGCVEPVGCASVDVPGGEARADGAVLAAGLRAALTPRFLVALEIRKPLMEAGQLNGPPGTIAEFDAPFFGFGIMVRTSPPGR